MVLVFDSYKLKTIIIVTHGGQGEAHWMQQRSYHLILIFMLVEFMEFLSIVLLSF